MARRSGLGRGLGALIPTDITGESGSALREVPVGSIAHVEAGTAQQMVNETDEEILVFVYGAPPERTGADVIDSAV